MRIAIITPTYPPYSSGISRMAEEEVKILEEAGFEVTVFTPRYSTPSNSPHPAFLRKSGTGGEKAGVKRLKPLFKYGNAAFIPQLLWKLRGPRPIRPERDGPRGFDAVHLHFPFLGATSIVLLWKKLFGRKTPLVITYHMDLRGQGIFKLIFYFYTKIITPFVLKSASRIVVTTIDYAQSSVFYQIFFSHRASMSKLIEIPPSVDIHKFFPDKKDKSLLKQLGIKEEDKVALFVGALDRAHYFKGIPTLLSAFELLYKRYYTQNAKLLIVGGGNLKNFYQKLVKKSPLISAHVIFAGRVADRDLPKFYNLSDFLVLPSTDSSEAFGIVILEAYASGIPVLASNLPGVRAVVEVKKNGLLAEPGDINDLADKLKKMFDEVSLYEWGREARYLAETKYSREIVGRKLVNVFKEFKF